MGEPSLGSGSLCGGCLEELPDSQSCLWGAYRANRERDKVAPRNGKWGQAGESRVLTTTATESIPADAPRKRR
jgi:hypothetical protein